MPDRYASAACRSRHSTSGFGPAWVVLVPQEAYVFPGTVRENLCYLQPWVEQPELERAIELFGLTDVVERLGGYDGEIEDPATELSSGERQLLVLVRAYVSGAAVVILDEASSHLDPVAEASMEAAPAAAEHYAALRASCVFAIRRCSLVTDSSPTSRSVEQVRDKRSALCSAVERLAGRHGQLRRRPGSRGPASRWCRRSSPRPAPAVKSSVALCGTSSA
jgi:hypothetical protein